jgi:hypothetical protein
VTCTPGSHGGSDASGGSGGLSFSAMPHGASEHSNVLTWSFAYKGVASKSDTESDEDTDLDDDGLLIQKATKVKSPAAPAPAKPVAAPTQRRPRATRPGGSHTHLTTHPS